MPVVKVSVPMPIERHDQHTVIAIEPGHVLDRTVFDFRQALDTVSSGDRHVRTVVVDRIRGDDPAWSELEITGTIEIELAHRRLDPVPLWWMRRQPFAPPLIVRPGDRMVVRLKAPRLVNQHGLIVLGVAIDSIEPNPPIAARRMYVPHG